MLLNAVLVSALRAGFLACQCLGCGRGGHCCPGLLVSVPALFSVLYALALPGTLRYDAAAGSSSSGFFRTGAAIDRGGQRKGHLLQLFSVTPLWALQFSIPLSTQRSAGELSDLGSSKKGGLPSLLAELCTEDVGY